jgi:predicted nicotinamide N-methyase
VALPLETRLAFVRERTLLVPVPAAPELRIHQATEVTPLWHATAAELEGWDASPYWAFPWAGGQVLARLVLDRPELVRGKAVFDFAAGSGLVALACARAGAARVVACDTDPFAEAAIRLNAEANGLAVAFRGEDPVGDALADFDLVLAGDVFYEEPLASRALGWFRALARRGARVLAGDPGRTYSPRAGVEPVFTFDVPTSREIERAEVLPARVLDVLWYDGGA